MCSEFSSSRITLVCFSLLIGALRKRTRAAADFSGPSSARTCVISKRTHVHFFPLVCKLDASHDNKNPTLTVYFGVSLCSVNAVWPPSISCKRQCCFATFHITAAQFEGRSVHTLVCQSPPSICSALILCDRNFRNRLFPDISPCLICLYPAFLWVVEICFMPVPVSLSRILSGEIKWTAEVNMIKRNHS